MLALAAIILTLPGSPPAHGAVSPAVIGGAPASDGRWMGLTPLLAHGVSAEVGQFCAGTVVAPRWVLTAAHCVLDSLRPGVAQPSDLEVAPGVQSLAAVGSARMRLERVLVHPDALRSGVLMRDIALLRTAEPILTAPMALASPQNEAWVSPGAHSIVAGWGATAYSPDTQIPSRFPDHLHEVAVSVLDELLCGQVYVFDRALHLCAGAPEGGRDACVGDSGGPLVMSPDGVDRIVGITSFGHGCGLVGFPGVYARVDASHEWICDHLDQPEQLRVEARDTVVRVHWPTTSACPWRSPTVSVTLTPGDLQASAPRSQGYVMFANVPAGQFEVNASLVSDYAPTPARGKIQVSPAPPETPAIMRAASIIGTARVGSALRVDYGHWRGAPEIRARWQRQRAGGWEERATGHTFTPRAADRGRRIRVVLEAVNATGRAEALTAPTAPVMMRPHVRIPGSLGSPRVGVALLAPAPTVRAHPAGTLRVSWQRRVQGSWEDIPGARTRRYVPRFADQDVRLRLRAWARNRMGTHTTHSRATAPVRR